MLWRDGTFQWFKVFVIFRPLSDSSFFFLWLPEIQWMLFLCKVVKSFFAAEQLSSVKLWKFQVFLNIRFVEIFFFSLHIVSFDSSFSLFHIVDDAAGDETHNETL